MAEKRRLGEGTSQALACCGDVPVCGNDASNLKPHLLRARLFLSPRKRCHLKNKKMMRCLRFLPKPYRPLDLCSRLLFCSLFGRRLVRGFDCGVGGVSERSGDVVLVPADALVYDCVLEAALIVIEAGFSGFHFDEDDFQV